jgi:hypothetical protein
MSLAGSGHDNDTAAREIQPRWSVHYTDAGQIKQPLNRKPITVNDLLLLHEPLAPALQAQAFRPSEPVSPVMSTFMSTNYRGSTPYLTARVIIQTRRLKRGAVLLFRGEALCSY